MKTLLYFFPFWLVIQNASFPTSYDSHRHLKVNKNFFRIGDQLITLENYGDLKDHSYILVNLYNDPGFSNAAFTMVQSQGTGFIRLMNKKGRNVEADLFDIKLVFDPDRIFTSWGRREHLKNNQCWSKSTDDYVQQFARFVLNEIPPGKTVVMFEEEPGIIEDYMQGGIRFKETRELYRATDGSKAIYLTPDEVLFNRLKSENVNVVLQHSRKLVDDGSLQVYCAKAGRTFLSIVRLNENPVELLEKVHLVLQ